MFMMKIVCMHFKIFLCLISLAILLGIITVTPCQRGQKCSLLGRAYAIDTQRADELTENAKNLICKMLKKN